uniref:cysteine dioxygenase n=1 Tax=Oryza sativa subsp. japonica TaxID=39947 RepID=Q7XR54_ORYSJ|nr:OSJNBa0043A12.31 [Oryza sativa Japonica Group]
MGIVIYTAGLPPSPPSGVPAYTVASVAADWCLRLHGWPIMPPLLGVYDFTAGLPPSPPSGASAYTAGLLCRRCWASTTSPPACLRRRRVVPPPTRLVYYAAAVGRLRLHRRPASVAAEWCLRLHGWPIMPSLLGVYDFTAGLPPSPPSGASAYTAGLLCRRCWASTTSPPARLRRRRVVPPPTRLAYYAAAVGRLRLHRRPASVAAEWCLRLHGWSIMPPLLGVYDFTTGLPPSPPTGVLAYTVGWSYHRSWASTSSPTGWPSPPPTGVSAYTASLLCRRCWASTTSPPACLRRRRLVSPPIRSVGHTTVDGHRHLHRRPASVAADWCLRLHGMPIMPPLLGVYDFTAGLPPSPPIGASAYTAGLLCRRCWASTTSPPACLRRRRVVPPPTRLAYYAAAVGRLRLHRRPASVAAEWCLRLHGWPIMPPLLGVYDFTAGLPPSPPSGASAYTAGLLCRRCWASTTSPPACLRRRRVVPPPTRLTYYAAVVGRLRPHRWLTFVAEWISQNVTTGSPRPPPTGVSACTAGLLCCRCWASTSSPTGRLVHCRLVFPPARLAFMPPLLGVYVFTDRPPRPPPTGVSACTAGLYAAVVGRLRLHRPAASSAADWCFRLHGWPLCCRCWASTSSPTGRLVRCPLVFPPARLAFMPPLLGVYVFTDRLAFAAADWCFRLHGWPLCRRCWASTSSPTGLPSPLPTGVSACTAGLYAAVVGRLRLHRPACLRRCRLVFPPARLAFMPPLLGVYVFTDRPPRPPPTDASACTTGLLCRRCWASTSSPTGRLVRRRLVLPPARLAYYAAVVGRLRLHQPAAASATADWCFRLHGWPLCRRCWASTSSPTGLPSPLLTGVSACTAGLYATVVGRLGLLCRRCWASTSSPTGRLVRRRLVLPPARLAYYAVVVGRLRLHRPACLRRCRLVFPPARLAFMPPLLGVYVFTDRPPRPPPTGASACTADLLCRRCWVSTSSPTGLPSPPPTGVSACTAGLYAAVVGRLRLHRPACLRRCRLVFPPARLAFMPPLLGVYVFTDRPPRPPPTGASACTADLLCRRCWVSTSSPTGLPSPPPTGVSACTAGLYAAVVGRLRLHRPACLRRCRLVFPPARLAFMPPLLGVYVFTDRPPRPPLTVCFCCRRLVFTSSRQCNFVIMVEQLHLYYLRHWQTLLLLLRKFCYFTNHDVFMSLDISACDAMLFYYNKRLSNIHDFYLDIFNTYLQSSNNYSTTRGYSSRLYVQLFPN